jgi:transcriptional regulator with XRE-family HTH domain
MATTDTEGKSLLNRAIARYGCATIARQVGLSEGALRQAAKGDTRPRPGPRAKLLELYEIPIESWERPPPPPAPVPVPDTTERVHAEGDHQDPRANTIETLRVLRERLASAPPEDVPEISRAIVQSSKLLAALSGQFEMTPAMVLRAPAWRIVKLAIIDALAQIPGSLEAMARALEALEA